MLRKMEFVCAGLATITQQSMASAPHAQASLPNVQNAQQEAAPAVMMATMARVAKLVLLFRLNALTVHKMDQLATTVMKATVTLWII